MKRKTTMKNIPAQLAPCGVYCGACPSYMKSCLGCASQDEKQKRKSKWFCVIRSCCYDEMGLSFCGECEKFPCSKVNKKVIDSHPGVMRFKYRHEIPENMKKLIDLGINGYVKYQTERWACPACGGRVVFYDYRCIQCGKDVMV